MATLPLTLTIMRILSIPIVATCYFLPWIWSHELAATIFLLSGLTDWLDGFLARRWHQTSNFGAFLDPVADKLLVVVAIMIVYPSLHYTLAAASCVIIICREIMVSALREWMAQMGKRTKINVVKVAKVKVTIQYIALFLLLLDSKAMPYIGEFMLVISAIMTLWSMSLYLRIAIPEFKR